MIGLGQRRYWRISQKISMAILFTTGIALIFSFAAMLVNDFYLYQKSQTRKLETLAAVLSGNTQASVAFGDEQSAETTLSALKAEKHVTLATIYTNDGKLFAYYRPEKSHLMVPATIGDAEERAKNGKFFHSEQPVTVEDRSLGTIYLEMDKGELSEMLWNYLRMAAIVLFLAMIVAFVISDRLQKKISAPIVDLAKLAKKVSSQRDYSVRAEKKTRDELGILMDNFNQMLGEIEKREKTLNNQWKWLQSVMDLMPTPFLLIEMGTGKVTFTNRAAADAAGGKFPFEIADKNYGQDEMFSCYGLEMNLLQKEELPSFRLSQGEKLSGALVNWLTPRGMRTLIVFGDALPSLHGHSSIGVLTFHDITDLKKTEQELKKIAQRLSESNAELAQSNKDLEQFAYIAAHDLQEPLRKIIAFSERLKTGGDGLSREEKEDFFTRMYNAGHRMKRVIEDLLQFSKVSRHDILYERVDLKTTLDEVISDLEMMISQAHAKITVTSLPEINANKSQMRHLFQNLITNSIKFCRKDLAPEILIESGSPTAEGLAEVRVRDNGIGFDEKYREKIFKPFQRLHAKDEYEGTGIGLAIVEKIVHNHGGKITANSRPNEGATFIITLPRQGQKTAA